MYQSAAKQYQKVNVTSEVLDADPHRLIQLLMEAALTRMAQAKGAIQRKDMEQKAKLLGRVNEIIQTLQTSLDHSKGGEISRNLDLLYDYMIRLVLQAGSQNNEELIDEVMGLLLEVKAGWDGIRQDYMQQVSPNQDNAEGTGSSLQGSITA